MKILHLTTLEVRRERGDLIQQFKMYKEIERVNMKQAQSMQSINVLGPASNIRGEKHRLKPELSKNCKTRQHFFTNRIVE
jgi:hypothetical protein